MSQIIESESTAKWQYSKQCEELSAEIKKLRQEICLLKRQENHSNHLRLVLSKSAAIVETILRQQRRRQRQHHQLEQLRFASAAAAATNSQLATAKPSASSTTAANQFQVSKTYLANANAAADSNHQAGCKTGALNRQNSSPPSGIISNQNNNKSINCDINNNNNSSLVYGDENADKVNREEEGGENDDDALCDLITRPNSVAAIEQAQLGVNFRGSGKSETSLLKRARSMEQEQEEHELAVRRTRRTSHLRQSSAVNFSVNNQNNNNNSATNNRLDDDKQRQFKSTEEALKSLVRSAKRVENSSISRRDATTKRHRSVDQLNLNRDDINDRKNLNQSDLISTQKDALPTVNDLSVVDDAEDEQAFSIELKSVVEALNKGILLSGCLLEVENSEEIRKIKKVQGFFRGWLCRRRWKQIVQEYIKSPHAESMRKRNNLVFKMVECEEEYVEQLTLLISSFLRPIKMAASSQKPALNHDELNSIFLNSETLLFLHQIFLKGLTARMESWPTLVLGDLFNMLLPMLTIYQEYVRNHHFSLQVLAECKQREQFSLILRRLEDKPQLNGRTLETFLTYPMHQVSNSIITVL